MKRRADRSSGRPSRLERLVTCRVLRLGPSSFESHEERYRRVYALTKRLLRRNPQLLSWANLEIEFEMTKLAKEARERKKTKSVG